MAKGGKALSANVAISKANFLMFAGTYRQPHLQIKEQARCRFQTIVHYCML